MRQNVGSENRLRSTRSFVLCSVLTDFYQAGTVAMAASTGSDAIANRTLTSNCRLRRTCFERQLVADELKIGAFLRDEFAVRSKFDNVTAVEHDDLIGLSDGAEPVSDDDDGATSREFT